MRIEPQTPTPATLAELGQRLATIRKQRGRSQEALADQAGLGVATLRRIEDGKDARLGSWLRILQALDLHANIEQLLPADYRSPMAQAKAEAKAKGKAAGGARRRTNARKATGPGFRWGDERP